MIVGQAASGVAGLQTELGEPNPKIKGLVGEALEVILEIMEHMAVFPWKKEYVVFQRVA